MKHIDKQIITDKVELAKLITNLVKRYGDQEKEDEIIGQAKDIMRELLENTDGDDVWWERYVLTEEDLKYIHDNYIECFGVLGRTLNKASGKREVFKTITLIDVYNLHKRMKGCTYELIVGKLNALGKERYGLATLADWRH